MSLGNVMFMPALSWTRYWSQLGRRDVVWTVTALGSLKSPGLHLGKMWNIDLEPTNKPYLSHPIIGPKLFCNIKKLLNPLRQFFIHETTCCSITCVLWDSTEPALCLRLTSAFTFLPFKETLLCVVLMSTILPSETAAADCVAWSHPCLHAASVELGADSSSHAGRHCLTGEVFLIGIKSLCFC